MCVCVSIYVFVSVSIGIPLFTYPSTDRSVSPAARASARPPIR